MICSVTDYNYLYKFLCLYESLDCPTSVLCIGDETYEKLKSLSLDNLTVYNVNETGLIRDETIEYGAENCTTQLHYLFSLAAQFPKYIMDNVNCDWVAYVDVDEYFYKSFDFILDNIGNKSIGITPRFLPDPNGVLGKFNTGVCYFKNDVIGKKALNLWVDCIINPNTPYRVEYGSVTCPDQKYIDLLWKKYKKDFKKLDVKHGAPYLFEYYENQEDYVFIHFMKFKLLENGYDWVHGVRGGEAHWNTGEFINIRGVKNLYDEYYTKSLEIIKKYNLIISYKTIYD